MFAAIANVRLPTEKAHGIQIMAMASAFAAAGQEVRLIVPRRRNPLHGDPFSFYGTPRTFRIVRVPTLDLLPWEKLLGPIAFWTERLTFACAATAAAWRARAVWTRDEYVALGLLLTPGARIAYEVHAPSPRLRRLYRSLARRGARIIAISGGVRDALVALGVPVSAVTVLPDAVDTTRFAPRPYADARAVLGWAADRRHVVYTGHLYAWKGAHALAEASASLPEDVIVHVVGGTPTDLAAFRSFLSERRLTRVDAPGPVPPDQVPALLAAADVVAIPNSGKEDIGARYTSPLKMYEAMAMARPIVASDVPSLREVLAHGRNAWLVPPDDPQALAAGIRHLLEHPDVAMRLAAQARADAGAGWGARAAGVLAALGIDTPRPGR